MAHNMFPDRNHCSVPARVPITAETICMGAANRYMGGKNWAATGIPARIEAGCCAMEIYTAAPKKAPQKNNARNSTIIIWFYHVIIMSISIRTNRTESHRHDIADRSTSHWLIKFDDIVIRIPDKEKHASIGTFHSFGDGNAFLSQDSLDFVPVGDFQ